jgi:hypothetical protein
MVAWLFLLLFSCQPDEEECQKVDFLFVIDNSGSMGSHQDNLRKNISSLIQELKSLNEVDFQIGVVTTDEYQYNPEQCRELGSLVTHSSYDENGSPLVAEDGTPTTRSCLSSDKKYINNINNLDSEFSCLASVGNNGSGNEKQLSALANALKDKDGCNKGFIRDDSLLVTMLITDEDANFDTGFLSMLETMGSNESLYYSTGSEWADAVLNIKGAYPNQVVVLSMINQGNSPELTNFTYAFPNGFVGDISAPSYAEDFKLAASKISTACKNYAETCPTNMCCYPNDMQRLLAIILLPLGILGITWMIFPVAMGKTAVQAGRKASYALKKGASISLLSTAATLFGSVYGLSVHCSELGILSMPMSAKVILALLLFSAAAMFLSSREK